MITSSSSSSSSSSSFTYSAPWRKRSVFFFTSLFWLALFTIFLSTNRNKTSSVFGGPASSSHRVSSSSNSHSQSLSLTSNSYIHPCEQQSRIGYPPVSIEWSGRLSQQVMFLKDPNLHITVRKNNFLGSTLWPQFWDVVAEGQWEPQTLHAIRFFLTGSTFVTGDKVAADAAFNHGKPLTAEQIEKKSIPTKAYIDFGAWIGPTVLFAALWTDRVYALEPDPLAFSALSANVASNSKLVSRIRLFFQCISSEEGDVIMEGSGDSTSRLTGKLRWDREAGSRWSVPCKTLPGFIEDFQIKDIGLIKIDVEGAELYLLPALLPWIQTMDRAKRPALWLSIHMPFWVDDEASMAATAQAIKDSQPLPPPSPTKLKQMQEVWQFFLLYKYVYTQDGIRVDVKPDNWETTLCQDFCTYLFSEVEYVPPSSWLPEELTV